MIKYSLLALSLLACGAENGDLFPDSPDGGPETGSLEEGISTKFSSSFTYGVSSVGSSLGKGTAAVGCGSGNFCYLPGYGTIHFKVTGTDPNEGNNSSSWKYQARRMMTELKLDTVNLWGYGWPFGAAIEDNNASTWVEITNGDCPTDISTNLITSVACIIWTPGSSPTVTESLPGAYKRFTGTAKVIFDNDALLNAWIDWGGPGRNGQDFHELVEHAAGAVIPALYGSGIYGSDKFYTTGQPTWSSPFIYSNQWLFTHSGYSQGEACRVGNLNTTSPSTFAAASGTCID